LGIDAGQLALMFLDLDEFKLINDHYGHRVGDAVLQEVAARVASAVGPCDVVARFGGDEFTVLCHVADQQHALVVAAKLAKALEAPILVESGLVNASMSIGIGVTSAPGTKPGDLLRQADGIASISGVMHSSVRPTSSKPGSRRWRAVVQR
jgi:diguanylate cyclase (GGDEF)-like protein